MCVWPTADAGCNGCVAPQLCGCVRRRPAVPSVALHSAVWLSLAHSPVARWHALSLETWQGLSLFPPASPPSVTCSTRSSSNMDPRGQNRTGKVARVSLFFSRVKGPCLTRTVIHMGGWQTDAVSFGSAGKLDSGGGGSMGGGGLAGKHTAVAAAVIGRGGGLGCGVREWASGAVPDVVV